MLFYYRSETHRMGLLCHEPILSRSLPQIPELLDHRFHRAIVRSFGDREVKASVDFFGLCNVVGRSAHFVEQRFEHPDIFRIGVFRGESADLRLYRSPRFEQFEGAHIGVFGLAPDWRYRRDDDPIAVANFYLAVEFERDQCFAQGWTRDRIGLGKQSFGRKLGADWIFARRNFRSDVLLHILVKSFLTHSSPPSFRARYSRYDEV